MDDSQNPIYMECEHTTVEFDRLCMGFAFTTTGFDGTTQTAWVGINEARGLLPWIQKVIEEEGQ